MSEKSILMFPKIKELPCTVPVLENSKPNNREERLFQHLDHVLDVSREKFDRETASNDTRQKWARIITEAIRTYGQLLHPSDRLDIKERIEEYKVTWVNNYSQSNINHTQDNPTFITIPIGSESSHVAEDGAKPKQEPMKQSAELSQVAANQ